MEILIRGVSQILGAKSFFLPTDWPEDLFDAAIQFSPITDITVLCVSRGMSRSRHQAQARNEDWFLFEEWNMSRYVLEILGKAEYC